MVLAIQLHPFLKIGSRAADVRDNMAVSILHVFIILSTYRVTTVSLRLNDGPPTQ